ncbi:MAG: L-threonylcarbamoyladenylate synthase [Candidatus Nanopelagicales bacterium]|nr:L-threonylcarbamoyladenylate synthase [Candidatus Nanopelagicales bacterium]
MSRLFDTRDPDAFAAGIEAAVAAAREGEQVVVSTESAYGVGADAFRRDGLMRLRQSKGRDAGMPVPVLVADLETALSMTTRVGEAGRLLMRHFWPGSLTIMARVHPALSWDVGGAEQNTVSVRIPLHQVAWRLVRELGPLALTGANLAGRPTPRTCDDAREQLGEAVAVYLDSGECNLEPPSSVVDVTADPPVLLRDGAIPLDQLRRVADVTRGLPVKSG